MSVSTEIDEFITKEGKGNVRDALNVALAELKISAQLKIDNAQLNKENVQLTDALYTEALRSVDAFALIIKVLEADEQDAWDALDMKPFVEWIEAFPKVPINSVTPTK